MHVHAHLPQHQDDASDLNAIVSDAPAGTTISVSPSSFSFAGGLTQTQTVTITVTLANTIATTAFGHLIFRDAATTLPDARMKRPHSWHGHRQLVPERLRISR